MRQRRSNSGMTLIEILIAVMILGIMAAAVVPVLGEYSQKAKQAREEANIALFKNAIARYETNHRTIWGYVYAGEGVEPIEYLHTTGQGWSLQLMKPTSRDGWVMGDLTAPAGQVYSYGPYIQGIGTAPASLLLGAGSWPEGYNGPDPESVTYIRCHYTSNGGSMPATGVAGDQSVGQTYTNAQVSLRLLQKQHDYYNGATAVSGVQGNQTTWKKDFDVRQSDRNLLNWVDQGVSFVETHLGTGNFSPPLVVFETEPDPGVFVYYNVTTSFVSEDHTFGSTETSLGPDPMIQINFANSGPAGGDPDGSDANGIEGTRIALWDILLVLNPDMVIPCHNAPCE